MRIPLVFSYWPLLLIWLPVSLLASLALGWAFHATHGDDQ